MGEGFLLGMLGDIQKTTKVMNLLTLANGIVGLRKALKEADYLTKKDKELIRKVLRIIEDHLETIQE